MRAFIRPLLLAFGLSTLLLAACSSESQTTSVETVAPSEAASSADFNDADVVFAQSMIPHHSEAIAMAATALVPSAGASAEVLSLAGEIQAAQDPEIAQMSSLLEAWGQPLVMAGMEDGASMAGMEATMSDEAMASMAELSGPDFDAAWGAAMIAHHEGAVSMAQTVKASGSNSDVLALADAIIAGQQAEIDQMRKMIDG